ncbi:putative reverse transcriptase domain-containing protein [Tanacetum coccineum]
MVFQNLTNSDTFYNSLNSNDQDALDSAAGGNFLDKMPQEGLAIIESKSKVRYSRSRANDSRDYALADSGASINLLPLFYLKKLELETLTPTEDVSSLPNVPISHPMGMSRGSVPLDGLHFDDKLQFVEEPVEIIVREVKRLKRSRIPLVKVRWNSRRGPEFTWEREDQFRKKYPHLFTKTAPSFSWVVFLRTKDETSAILKDFIRQIENQLNQKVKTIRSDNGTEFKNKEKDGIDVGDSEKEDDSAQDCFILPIWPSYSSTNTPAVTTDDKKAGPREEEQVFIDDLERLKKQEKEAYEDAEALNKKFETLVIKEGVTAVFMRTPSCDPTHSDEDASGNTSIEKTVVNVSPIPTSRIHSTHPRALILGDPNSTVQIRSKVNTSSGAHAFVS